MKKTLVALVMALAVAGWAQTAPEAPSSPAPSPTPAPETVTTMDAVGQLIPNGLKLYQATAEAFALLKTAPAEIKKSP